MRRSLFVLVPVSLLALAAHRLTGGECPTACTLGGVAGLFGAGEACATPAVVEHDAGAPRGRYVEARPTRTWTTGGRELLDGSGHCWCARTALALGPDKEVVDPETCTKERGCFRSALEPPRGLT